MEITRENYQKIISAPSNFKDVSVFIGLPCYGGNMNCLFVQGLVSLLACLGALNIKFSMYMLGSESLVTRARNTIANAFYFDAKKFSHLLFLDCDVQFNPADVLAMLASGEEFVGLPYARKSVDWERIADAVKAGAPAGILSTQVSDPVFTLLPNGPRQTTSILEVQDIGCGGMLLARSALERLANSYSPERTYKLFTEQAALLKMQGFDRDFAVEFFQSRTNADRVFLSEDFALCEDWRKLGGKIFLIPWARTIHHGPFGYACDLTIPSFHLKKSEVAPCQ